MHQLDHIMWAAADLDAACALFRASAGVELQPGGSHPGLGTRNRLTGLGGSQYFEAIAPDPDQPIEGTFGEQFRGLANPRIHALIYATAELERVVAIYRSVGIEAGIVEASRLSADGQAIRWRMLSIAPGPVNDYVPRFLDWQGSPHPSARVPHQCSLRSLAIYHNDPLTLLAIWRAHGLDPYVAEGAPRFTATLQTPKGHVEL